MGFVTGQQQDTRIARIEFHQLRVKYGDPITGKPLAPTEYGKRRFDWTRTEVNEYYCNGRDTMRDLEKEQITVIELNDKVADNKRRSPNRSISRERILFTVLFTLLDPFVAVCLMG